MTSISFIIITLCHNLHNDKRIFFSVSEEIRAAQLNGRRVMNEYRYLSGQGSWRRSLMESGPVPRRAFKGTKWDLSPSPMTFTHCLRGCFAFENLLLKMNLPVNRQVLQKAHSRPNTITAAQPRYPQESNEVRSGLWSYDSHDHSFFFLSI